MLGEIFNDPSATSLTKLNLEDSDSDNDDISGSGSELWTGSGELPKPSEDSSSQSETVTTDNSQRQQQSEPSKRTETTVSENTDGSSATSGDDAKDATETTSSESTDNSTDSTGADNEDTNTTPESTNPAIASTAAQNVPQQSSTDSSPTLAPVATQEADAKLPSTEDQSQNSVVQTEENNKSSNDTSATNANVFPAQTQSSLETVTDDPAAALVGQQAPGFDDNSLYDPTIVKKTDIPVGSDSFWNPLGMFIAVHSHEGECLRSWKRFLSPSLGNGCLIC